LQRFLLRLAYAVPGGYTVRPALHRLRGTRLGNNVWISQQVYIDEIHPEAVTIGNNCTIGLRTSIFTHFYWGPRRSNEDSGPVVIEDDVFVGPHCVILPGVHIGRGAVIRAGTVVTRNVPAETFWGAPAAEPLAHATVPLTPERNYEEFVAGLRPMRRKRKAGGLTGRGESDVAEPARMAEDTEFGDVATEEESDRPVRDDPEFPG
jgi:carbonic anhydrase/acetyltransferase-like protein (isoleucine patch superfamily)